MAGWAGAGGEGGRASGSRRHSGLADGCYCWSLKWDISISASSLNRVSSRLMVVAFLQETSAMIEARIRSTTMS